MIQTGKADAQFDCNLHLGLIVPVVPHLLIVPRLWCIQDVLGSANSEKLEVESDVCHQTLKVKLFAHHIGAISSKIILESSLEHPV